MADENERTEVIGKVGCRHAEIGFRTGLPLLCQIDAISSYERESWSKRDVKASRADEHVYLEDFPGFQLDAFRNYLRYLFGHDHNFWFG